ncbi:MAG TPA: hypothetical protein VIX11_01120 [Candidatus Acidoferrum sp.]
MLNIYQRAADDLDPKALTRGGGSLRRNLLVVVLPISLVLSGCVYFLWRSVLIASVVGVGLFLASSYSNIRFFQGAQRRESQKTNEKAVEVFEVSDSRVLDIELIGDDGPAFCFFAGGEKAMLLIGQWLMDYDSFPSESFRLHCWADTKKPIRIEVTGATIEPEHSTVKLRPNHKYGPVELFGAAPETLQNDLDRALHKDSA